MFDVSWKNFPKCFKDNNCKWKLAANHPQSDTPFSVKMTNSRPLVSSLSVDDESLRTIENWTADSGLGWWEWINPSVNTALSVTANTCKVCTLKFTVEKP